MFLDKFTTLIFLMNFMFSKDFGFYFDVSIIEKYKKFPIFTWKVSKN